MKKVIYLAALVLAAGSAQAVTFNNSPEREALQFSQSAHHQGKAKTAKGYGHVFTVGGDGIATLDGVPCAIDEQTAQATVYTKGVNKVIAYKSGKVALMESGVFVGAMKY